MFSVKEMKQKITNKEWDKIAKESKSLLVIHANMDKLPINFEFVEELIFNEERFNKLVLNTPSNLFKFPRLLSDTLLAHFRKIPKSFWDKWIDNALSLKVSPTLTKEFIIYFYDLSDKPKEYYEAYLDRSDEIIKQIYNWNFELNIYINNYVVKKLSKGYRKKLADLIYNFPNSTKHLFLAWMNASETLKLLAPNMLDGLDLILRIANDKFDVGKIYQDTTLEEFEEIVAVAPPTKHSGRILSWYKHNPQITKVSDFVIKTIIVNKWDAGDLVNILTKKQIYMLGESGCLGIDIIAKNKDIPLEKLAELAKGKFIDVFHKGRFFTEEEIHKYPNLIRPYFYYMNPMTYMSKETFDMLCEKWKEDYNWKEEYISFENIVLRLKGDTLTQENIEYLGKKTGTPKNKMFSILMKLNLNSAKVKKSKFLRNLSILQQLRDKYT